MLSEYNHWARKRSIQRSIGVVMATALAGAASLIGVVTFATAPASAAPTGTCTFSGTGVVTASTPPGTNAYMTGAVAGGNGPTVPCTGLSGIGLASPLVITEAAPTAGVISPSADGGNDTYLGYTESQGYETQSNVSTFSASPFVLPSTTTAIGGCPVSAIECELGSAYYAPDPDAACPANSAWPEQLVNAGFVACNITAVISTGTGANDTDTLGAADIIYSGQNTPHKPTATLSSTAGVTAGQTVTVTGGTNWWGTGSTPDPGTIPGVAGGASTSVPAPSVWVGTSRATAVEATSSLSVTAAQYNCTGGGGGSTAPGPAISCSAPVQGVMSGTITIPSGLAPGSYNVYIDQPNTNPIAGENNTGYNDGLSDAGFTAVESSTPITVGPTVTGVAPAAGPAGGSPGVVITGTNFVGVTAVNFGPYAASTSSIVVNSPTQITVTAPPSDLTQEFTSQTVDVQVTANGVQSVVNSPADNYTYELPFYIIAPPPHPIPPPIQHCFYADGHEYCP